MTQAAQSTVFVDGNHVMGSRPDGWWHDRAEAARRLVAEIIPLALGDGHVWTIVFDGKEPPAMPQSPECLTVIHTRHGHHDGAADRIVEEEEFDMPGLSESECCFADYVRTDLPDYFARWVRGFPTVFRDRRKMGRLAGCRTAVGGSSRFAAPSLRYGPAGDPPPSARRSASMAVSAASGHGPIAPRLVVSAA